MSRAQGGTLLVLLGALLASAVRDVWTLDPDAAAYLTLGRSLAQDGSYALDGVPHAKYPPGLPALLAGLMRLAGPEAYGLFHQALVLAVVAAAGLTWCLGRRLGLAPAPALALAACTGLAVSLFDLSLVYLRSEPLFLVLSLGAMLLALRAMGPDGSLGQLAGAVALSLAAMATRLAGVALAALALRTLLSRQATGPQRLRALALALACALAALGWQARGASIARQHPQATDYGAELFAAEPRDLTKVVRLDNPPLDGPALARRLARNGEVLLRASATLLTNVERAAHRLPVGALLFLLVGAGLVQLLRAGGARTDLALYTLAMMGLYLVWPFNQQERFYVPLLPALLLAVGEGLAWVHGLARAGSASPVGRRWLLGAGLALLAVLAAQRSDHPVLLGRWSLPYAALLAFTAAGLGAFWALTRRGGLAALPAKLFLLAPLLFALTFAARRFGDWPDRVSSFESRRAVVAVPAALQRIDVHPVLERVGIWLGTHTAPDAVVMTDVPKMMTILSGRRCTPYVYRLDPPEVVTGGADLIFYTGEIPEAAEVLQHHAGQLEPVLTLEPVGTGDGRTTPTVYRVRP